MTIRLTNTNTAFYEIPKTGSTFIREALTRVNISYELMSPYSYFQSDPPPIYEIGSKDYTNVGYYRHSPWWAYPYIKDKYCIVRHPISWYESFWKFFMSLKPEARFMGFFSDFLLPDNEIENSFSDFINRIINHHPSMYTRMIESFIGPNQYNIMTEILKTENLNNDLIQVLKNLGYDKNYNLNLIHDIDKQNVSDDYDLIWGNGQKKQILYLEQEVLRRFNYDYEPPI